MPLVVLVGDTVMFSFAREVRRRTAAWSRLGICRGRRGSKLARELTSQRCDRELSFTELVGNFGVVAPNGGGQLPLGNFQLFCPVGGKLMSCRQRGLVNFYVNMLFLRGGMVDGTFTLQLLLSCGELLLELLRGTLSCGELLLLLL